MEEKRVNPMVHIKKGIGLILALIVLTACGINDEPVANEEVEDPQVEQMEAAEESPQKAVETKPSNEKTEPKEPSVEESSVAEEPAEFDWLLDELNGKAFIFSSGVGAWRTGFTFSEDGHFEGKYSDADGPEIAVSEFTGTFTIEEAIDEWTYLLALDDFQVTSETGTEEVDGEMRITYVEEPHGFQWGSEWFELYLPYKPKEDVTYEYLSWVYGQANNGYDFLNSFGLYNRTHEFGMEEQLD